MPRFKAHVTFESDGLCTLEADTFEEIREKFHFLARRMRVSDPEVLWASVWEYCVGSKGEDWYRFAVIDTEDYVTATGGSEIRKALADHKKGLT